VFLFLDPVLLLFRSVCTAFCRTMTSGQEQHATLAAKHLPPSVKTQGAFPLLVLVLPQKCLQCRSLLLLCFFFFLVR